MLEITNSFAKMRLGGGTAVFTGPDGGGSVCLFGTEEFVVYLKEGERTEAVFSTLTEKIGEYVSPEGDCIKLTYSHSSFDAEVRYVAEEDSFSKTVVITQKGGSGVEIRRVCVEARKCSLRLFRGGEGQPVFAEGDELGFYCGCESPAAQNVYFDNVLNFTQALFSREKTVVTIPVVYGLARGSAFAAFAAHIKRAAVKTEKYRVYSDWALRDDLTPGDPVLSEKLTLENLDTIEAFMAKSGVRFDTYLMDAFWFEDRKPYTEFKKTAFPRGIGEVLERVRALGLDFGLWFDINGIHTHLADLEQYREYDSGLGNHALCLACDEAAELLYNGIKTQINDCNIKAIKLDFGYFECKNPEHGHSTLPDEYKEKAVANFIKVIRRLRQDEPRLKVLCYNGWTTTLDHIGSICDKPGFAVSPYWSMYADYVYCGDPRPSETPFESVADSVCHYTDAMFYSFMEAGMPASNVDDDGVLVGTTGTIYRLGRSTFRRGLLTQALRGTRKLHFYGDLRLLNGADTEYFAFVDRLFDKLSDFEFELLPGDPRRNELYGYRARSTSEGYALVFAPEPYDTYYPLDVPGECGVEVIVENGEIVAPEKRRAAYAKGTFQAFVRGGGYVLVHYVTLKNGQPADGPTRAEMPGYLSEYLPGSDAYIHGELFGILLAPGDNVFLATSGFRLLQLMFRDENGRPLRLPSGLANGISVSAGGTELPANFREPVWSGISHVQFDVAGLSGVSVKNEGKMAVKMWFRRLETEKICE